MTIKVALMEATARLAAAGVEDARRDARLLLAAATGAAAGAHLADDAIVDAAAAARFAAMVDRRAAREPVSRILGRRGFWTLDLAIGPDTLDPRPDSETVVEAVLARVTDRRAMLRVLDLGTGSGCLLLALLAELPNATGLGIDRAAGAVALARANAVAAQLDGRAEFRVGDWTRGLSATFDIVVANPPYIRRADLDGLMPEVARFDPRAALDGGADGLDAYRAILAGLKPLLAPGAIAAFEIGAGQGEAVKGLINHAGLATLEIRPDLAGIDRCIVATGG
ncbi:MAG: peptide chain release factor N(5)-glutamine methyltransferase [Alphaproteobacteria bacterium]|nr:peptide chain release factor N(5)-glutamine methyltransferase [Alphaproteobacteria bacterium]